MAVWNKRNSRPKQYGTGVVFLRGKQELIMFCSLDNNINLFHNSVWHFFKRANSLYEQFGQNQQPPRFANLYIGESKSYFLHKSYAIFSV